MENSNNKYILSAPIHSGKTAALQNWIKNKQSIYGFICPDIKGRRKLIDLLNKKQYTFQLNDQSSADDILIGKYIFSAKTFQIASQIMIQACRKDCHYIVIDEIGKLELEDKGLEPALSEMIHYHKKLDTTIIFVVRDYLLQAVIEKYNFQKVTVISKTELLTIT